MSHRIEQRIRNLRARVRRLVVVYGVSWIVAVVVGVVIVLGFADYLIRLQDRGLRVICSLLVLAGLVWTCYRYLYLPWMVRLSEVDLALRLQRRFPALEDRLVSSVEFLKQSEDDPVAGSPALRRAVVAQTTAETERLDFSEALDRRPPLRAAMVTVSICLVAAILLVFRFDVSKVAVARVVNPFAEITYPQKNRLMLCVPVERVARGQMFEIEVVDEKGRKLPKQVRIHYRFEDPEGNTTEEVELMQFVDATTATRGLSRAAADLRKRGMMIVRRENVTQPFSYWVEGGDDSSMAYRPVSVEVVDPPGLESPRVKLTPPAYTGWPSDSVKGKLIRALVGTRVQISARATRPLKSALLHLEDGRQIDGGPTGQKRRTVAAEFEIENVTEEKPPGSIRFELIDREDLTGQFAWEIVAVPDQPPTASIQQPSDTVFATPQAVVPLKVVAKDDLAIHQLALVFRPSNRPEEGQPQPEESVQPLYTGPESVDPQPAGGLSRGTEQRDLREFEHRWELADLELAPGTELTFRVTATDYRSQTGQSEPRRLVVITQEQLHQRIADRQSQIVAELTRVLKMQRGSRKQIKSLEIRLAEIGHLERLDVDRLQGAELNQREISRSLTSRSAGLPMHVLALLADLDNNRLDSPDVPCRMQARLDEIERLRREHLALIGREMTAAIKSAQLRAEQRSASPREEKRAEPSSGPSAVGGYGIRTYPPPPVAASLAEAGRHQDEVIDSLERLLEQLAEWDKYRRFHREIGQLLREQEELRSRTSEVGRRTLGKELKDLPPQDVADLKVFAGQQLDLARQFDRIQQRMGQAVVELRQSDPLAAQTVADALAEARRRAISGQMLSAGSQVGRNQIGQATAQQGQIERDLQEVLDILANRRQHELARLLKKLSEAEHELAHIERRQARLRKKMEASLQDADDARRRQELQRLGQQQTHLQQETERLARRLERLLADQAGATTRQAAGHMGQAGQCAGQGNCPGACQAAAAAHQALQQAQRQLAARRRQAHAQLAMEQLARLEDELKHLRQRQQNILEETERYAGLQAQGELSRAQTAGLRNLARQQGALQTETGQLGDRLSGAGAFRLTLSVAGQSMGRAAALLHRQQTGLPTQEAEEHVLGRLDLLLAALKKEPPSEAQSGAAGAKAGQGGRPGAVQRLAELKLLKLLQEEVNLRTEELQSAVDAAESLTDEHRRQYAALSEEQGRLAVLTPQLLEVEQGAPEDDPAGLPDLQPDRDEGQGGLLPNEEDMP